MTGEPTLHEIPYFEYKTINELVHAHRAEYKSELKAVIVFGTLKTSGGTYDIEVLEVFGGLIGELWRGNRLLQAGSTAELPMRGKLDMNLISAKEFERVGSGSESPEIRELLQRVLEGYEIVYEVPAGYARNILLHARETKAAGEQISDPRRPFPREAASV